jgi:hypothetical protein
MEGCGVALSNYKLDARRKWRNDTTRGLLQPLDCNVLTLVQEEGWSRGPLDKANSSQLFQEGHLTPRHEKVHFLLHSRYVVGQISFYSSLRI